MGRIRLPAAIALVVALLLAAAVAGCGSAAKEPTIDELLSLGEKYLSELHYDQALAQFMQAIELEPRSAEAYLGAAEAYVGMGRLDEAATMLQRGIELTGDERLRERLEALLAVQAPENQHEAPPIEDPIVARTLYEYLLAGDNEAAYAYCLSEEFLAACAALEEGAFRFYGDIGAQGELEGLAVAYYPYQYVYFGGWKDGAREGEGLYFEIQNGRQQFYKGTWANDFPNGAQLYTLYRDEHASDFDGSHPIYGEMTGLCVNGLWNGEVEDIDKWQDGHDHYFRYTLQNGICDAIGEADDDGFYPVAYCTDGCGITFMSDINTVHGVFPFDEMSWTME